MRVALLVILTIVLALILLGCAANPVPWTQQKELVTCELPDKKLGRKEAVTKSRTVYREAKPYRQFYIVKELSACGAR